MAEINADMLKFLDSQNVKYSYSISGEAVFRLSNASLNELLSILLQGVAISLYKKEIPVTSATTSTTTSATKTPVRTPVNKAESSSDEGSTPKKPAVKKMVNKLESSSDEETIFKKVSKPAVKKDIVKKVIEKIESSSDEETTPKKSSKPSSKPSVTPEKKIVSPNKSVSSSEKKLLAVFQEMKDHLDEEDYIEQLRNKVSKKTFAKLNTKVNFYPDITEEFIQELVHQYDRIFLNGYIKEALKEKKLTLQVLVSTSMTKTAGSVGIKSGKIVFKISNPVLMGVTPVSVKQGVIANTDELVTSRLDAVMQIVEHELIHVITLLYSPTQELNAEGKYDIAEHHGTWFTNTADVLFGHTRVTHMLIPSGRSTPTSLRHTKNDFKLGQKVHFMDRENNKIKGKVIKINPKKAVVMANDQRQFRVPYIILHPDR